MSGGEINVPIVFRGPNGAAARVAAQHSQCFISWFYGGWGFGLSGSGMFNDTKVRAVRLMSTFRYS